MVSQVIRVMRGEREMQVMQLSRHGEGCRSEVVLASFKVPVAVGWEREGKRCRCKSRREELEVNEQLAKC